MQTPLFAYGWLLFPSVVYELTGKHFCSSPAKLFDYKRIRYLNRDRCPPPISLPSKGSVVEGKVLWDVDQQSLSILDLFEGIPEGEYERIKVSVLATSDHDARNVLVDFYKPGKSVSVKEDVAWSPEKIYQKDEQFYIENVVQPFLAGIK